MGFPKNSKGGEKGFPQHSKGGEMGFPKHSKRGEEGFPQIPTTKDLEQRTKNS